MLVPKLSKVFIYTCYGKYKNNNDFIKYIDTTPGLGRGDCWLWTGCKSKKGYGRISRYLNKKSIAISTHRAAYEMATGELIPTGICICHRCDIRKGNTNINKHIRKRK
jgi:hypothetical protein